MKEQSLTQIRSRLYGNLRSNGVIDSLKSQLRVQVLGELQRAGKINASIEDTINCENNRLPTLYLNAINSLFADYLKFCKFQYTLSVFLPECGMSGGSTLNREDILQVLNIAPGTTLFRALADSETRDFHEDDVDVHPNQALLTRILRMGLSDSRCHSYDASTQTNEFDGCTQALSLKLRAVEETFEKRRQGLILDDPSGRRIEERMLHYQRECDTRALANVKQEVERFRELELVRMREEERSKFRIEYERKTAEMEKNYNDRLERLRCREKEVERTVAAKERDHEASLFEERQRVLLEMESIKRTSDDLKRRQETMERERRILEERVREKESLLDARRADIERARERTIREAREDALRSVEDMKAEYHAKIAQVDRDKVQVTLETQALHARRDEFAKMAQENHSMREEISVLRQRTDKLRDDLDAARDALTRSLGGTGTRTSLSPGRTRRSLRDDDSPQGIENLKKRNEWLECAYEQCAGELAEARSRAESAAEEHRRALATAEENSTVVEELQERLEGTHLENRSLHREVEDLTLMLADAQDALESERASRRKLMAGLGIDPGPSTDPLPSPNMPLFLPRSPNLLPNSPLGSPFGAPKPHLLSVSYNGRSTRSRPQSDLAADTPSSTQHPHAAPSPHHDLQGGTGFGNTYPRTSTAGALLDRTSEAARFSAGRAPSHDQGHGQGECDKTLGDSGWSEATQPPQGHQLHPHHQQHQLHQYQYRDTPVPAPHSYHQCYPYPEAAHGVPPPREAWAAPSSLGPQPQVKAFQVTHPTSQSLPQTAEVQPPAQGPSSVQVPVQLQTSSQTRVPVQAQDQSVPTKAQEPSPAQVLIQSQQVPPAQLPQRLYQSEVGDVVQQPLNTAVPQEASTNVVEPQKGQEQSSVPRILAQDMGVSSEASPSPPIHNTQKDVGSAAPDTVAPSRVEESSSRPSAAAEKPSNTGNTAGPPVVYDDGEQSKQPEPAGQPSDEPVPDKSDGQEAAPNFFDSYAGDLQKQMELLKQKKIEEAESTKSRRSTPTPRDEDSFENGGQMWKLEGDEFDEEVDIF